MLGVGFTRRLGEPVSRERHIEQAIRIAEERVLPAIAALRHRMGAIRHHDPRHPSHRRLQGIYQPHAPFLFRLRKRPGARELSLVSPFPMYAAQSCPIGVEANAAKAS